MFVNKDKKSYEIDYVINSIKKDKDYKVGYHNCLDLYNDGDWCNQFIQTLYKEFEIVTIRNVSGMKNGFYIVDKNYSKFCNSSFLLKKIKKVAKKLNTKQLNIALALNKSIMVGKQIVYHHPYNYLEKYVIQYIKDNTIKFYTYDEFVEEFNPQSIQPLNNRCYQPHTKSHHTVNGFWRKQQYGSRSNPQYKMIWIESFERGGKKVG